MGSNSDRAMPQSRRLFRKVATHVIKRLCPPSKKSASVADLVIVHLRRSVPRNDHDAPRGGRVTLTLNSYQERTAATDRTRAGGGFHLAALGLVGETGSLLSEVKKKQRDARS